MARFVYVRGLALSLWVGAAGVPLVGASGAMTLETFDAVEVRCGGHVTVRHGAGHRATVRSGSATAVRLEVDRERLVVDACGAGSKRSGEDVEVEVETPGLAALAVMHGGRLEVAAGFPAPSALAVAVEHGGAIDARALEAESVQAAVSQGGAILVRPRATLLASIAQGGRITYWGKPRVTQAVEHGGMVAAGRPGDAARPLAELMPRPPAPVAPVPPVPPVPAI